MVPDTGRRPLIDPQTWVAVEVDSGCCVANRQEWFGDHGAFGGHEREPFVLLLAESEQSDRAGLDVEFHTDPPAALAVVTTQSAQQGVVVALTPDGGHLTRENVHYGKSTSGVHS